MRSSESNLAFVRACLDELQDYESATTLFWTLSARPPAGSQPFLQMTLGNLVLALDEMRAVEATLSPRDRTTLARAQAEWQTDWAGRSARLENKAMREVASRIAQWRAYVAEALESGDLSEYAANVRPRLCAVRLLEWLGPGNPDVDHGFLELEAAEASLVSRMEDGPCVLGAELAAIYPPAAPYLFLYRRPRRPENRR